MHSSETPLPGSYIVRRVLQKQAQAQKRGLMWVCDSLSSEGNALNMTGL